MITFYSYLADCEGFESKRRSGAPDYACDKQDVLREFLELPCRISHDTASADRLNRVFRRLDPTQLCLAQSQIGNKTNKTKAIPDRLKPLDITGSVVTIDAIGCRKTIAELIIDKKQTV